VLQVLALALPPPRLSSSYPGPAVGPSRRRSSFRGRHGRRRCCHRRALLALLLLVLLLLVLLVLFLPLAPQARLALQAPLEPQARRPLLQVPAAAPSSPALPFAQAHQSTH